MSLTDAVRPTVSVIIPVYNTEKYIDEAIQSIRDQTLADIEIVCVNDASTDQSSRIIEHHVAEDPRVQLVTHGENRGVGAARNTGVGVASGRYLYFFDSDDRLSPEALEELVSLADGENLDVVYFDAVPFFESEATEASHGNFAEYYQRKTAYRGVMSGRELFTSMVDSGREWRASPCLQFLRTDFYREHGLGFPEGVVHEDNFFSIRVAMHAERVRHVPKRYFHRRVREGSIMTVTPTVKHAYGMFNAYVDTSALARELGIQTESPLGRALQTEIDALFKAGVRIMHRLESDQLTALRAQLNCEFLMRDVLALAEDGHDELESELDSLRAQLRNSEAHVRELEMSFSKRVERRVRRELKRFSR